MTAHLSNFKKLFTSVIESFAVADMTTVASAVLFCLESEGSGFNANERP